MPIKNTSNETKKEKRKSWSESFSDYIPLWKNKDDTDSSPEIDETKTNPHMAKLEKNIRRLKKDKEILQQKITDLTDNLEETEKKLEVFGQCLDRNESERQKLLEKIDNLELKVADYKEKEKQLNNELAKEKLKGRQMTVAFNHQLKKQRAELIAERDRRPNIALTDYHNLIGEKNNYLQDVRDLMTENRQFKNDIDDRIAERDAETARADNLQTQLNNANQNITSLTNEKNGYEANIINARTKLGIPLLRNLPTLPSGKTLPDLINFFNNPPNCLNPSHSNYDAIKQERDNLKTELSTTQQERNDYKLQSENAEQAKAKLVQEKETLQTKNEELEIKILQKIINDCKLWDTERERERERAIWSKLSPELKS